MSSTHETFTRQETIEQGSDRAFGLTMAAVLTLISAWNWYVAGTAWRWTITAGAIFALAAVIHPAILAPLNRAWLKLGLLLHKIVNPVIMAFVFYGAVLPTGLARRALGKDSLRLNRDPAAKTYWIRRTPAGPAADTMRDQF